MTFPKIISIAAVAMAGAMATPAMASFDDQFRCEPVGDGEHLVIFSARDADKASVQYQVTSENAATSSGAALTKLNAVYNYPESGARYVGGEYMVLTTNRTVVLLYGVGTPNPGHTECSMPGSGPEDAGDAYGGAKEVVAKLDVRARSWGGKLRAGPGMDYDQTGSLREGERVTLIENTFIDMNGYNWFKIRRANGQEGYKWGGILCSNALHVIGLYDKCMDD